MPSLDIGTSDSCSELRLGTHEVSGCSDISQGQIPSCAPGKNFIVGTKLCPRDLLHEFKLTWISATCCRDRTAYLQHVPSTVHATSFIRKVLGQTISQLHLTPNNTPTHYSFQPWVITILKLVNQVKQVPAKSLRVCREKGTRLCDVLPRLHASYDPARASSD